MNTDRIPDTLGLFDGVRKGKSLVSCLNTLLPSVMAGYIKAQGYHWNVVGPDFVQLHDFLGGFYADLYESLDPLAENIRKLGQFPMGDIDSMAGASRIGRAIGSRDGYDMIRDLIKCNQVILDLIAEACECAEDEDQQGILDFLAGRQDAHMKWDWQMKAIAGES